MSADRDPKTGHFKPGHSLANTAARVCAYRMAELRALYYEVVTEDDMREAHAAHMELIRQSKDAKVRLGALELLYDRCMGRAEQQINVNSETKSVTAHVELTAEQQAVIESICSPAAPRVTVIDVPAPAVKPAE